MLAGMVSVSAARSVSALQATRETGAGRLEPGWGATWSASLVLPGAIVATLIGAAATGVLAGASLYAAREFGLAVAVGLLIDLVLLRAPLIAALTRWARG
jgi:hypothetical protein